MEPMVSICTAAYQHAPYIAKALDSFLMQKTTFPFEILIHDDASTDGTVEILREYQAKYPDIVKPLFEDENQYSKGVPIDPTFNFSRARGKYIALCEGDDCWLTEDKLQKQVDYMEAHPDCTFCFTNAIITDVSGKVPDRDFLPYYEEEKAAFPYADHDYLLGDMAALNFIPTASFLFPRAVWERVQEEYFRKKCEYGDLKMRMYFTSEGYAHYLHLFSCLYRENVSGSAFQVWKKESAEKTVRRAASAAEMLDDVDRRTGSRFKAELQPIKDRFLFVELWNTTEKKPLSRPEMRRVYKALPAKQRLRWRLKRLLPRKLIDFAKKFCPSLRKTAH